MAQRGKKAPAKKASAGKKARAGGTSARGTAGFDRLANQAQFVFRGTVQQRGASTLDQVELTRDTLIVTVQEILKSPEVLLGFEGRDITVQLPPGERVNTGEPYLFYTNGWIYGTGLAVRAIAVAPDSDVERRQTRVALETAPMRAVQERAQRAELVVSGRISEVRQVPRSPGTPITEHDPLWQQAVIAVDSVETAASGALKNAKQVVIRFAASPDVRWAAAPKFSVGESGMWMLGDKKEGAALRAAAGADKNEFVVIEPEDYYPLELSGQVRSLLRKEGGDER